MYILGEIVLNEEDPLLVGSRITKNKKSEEMKYSCDKCEYSATRPIYLRDHIKIKHEGVRNLCDKCNFSTTSRRSSQRTHQE